MAKRKTKAQKQIKAAKLAKRQKRRQSRKDQRNRSLNINQFVEDHAYKLRINPPNSDIWFQGLWKDLKHEKDEYNIAFKGKYIPDCINTHYKYIIEIDGSFHDSEKQQRRDRRKDEFYSKQGYVCYRIKAYCSDSFNEIKEKVFTIRNKVNKNNVILRKNNNKDRLVC